MTNNVVPFSEKRLEKNLQKAKEEGLKDFNDLATRLENETASTYLENLVKPLFQEDEETVTIQVPMKAKLKNGNQFLCIFNATLKASDLEIIKELEPDSG